MMQVLSLMPGVSRSGIIITVGRLLNFNGTLIPFAYISKKDREKIKEGFEILKNLLRSTSVSYTHLTLPTKA